jgi:hypothetical protein
MRITKVMKKRKREKERLLNRLSFEIPLIPDLVPLVQKIAISTGTDISASSGIVIKKTKSPSLIDSLFKNHEIKLTGDSYRLSTSFILNVMK